MKPAHLKVTAQFIIFAAFAASCAKQPGGHRGAGGAALSREKMAHAATALIPRPAVMIPGDGFFRMEKGAYIAGPWNDGTASALAASLSPLAGFTVRALPGSGKTAGAVTLSLEGNNDKDDESYSMLITPAAVSIKARCGVGLFRGAQTFLQLAHISRTLRGNGPLTFPSLTIEDSPRFPWRGVNLDCARHFMPVEYIKRTIDILALYRMNILHLHLTDDQGWRLEIRKYPKLTEIGAWRRDGRGGRYGGFYTQEEMRGIVAYASKRHIVVVPEIEMPGHCQAALAAYPELSCTGGPFPVSARWGVHREAFCAEKEETFRFIEDVLDEVMTIFPSPHIHVGGDECLMLRWRHCPLCQGRIARENLVDEKGLQGYFIRRIGSFLKKRGRSLVGWDEIIEGGLPPGAVVQSWRGFRGAFTAASSGYDTIVSPTSHVYFDYGPAFTNLKKAYSFDPEPPDLGHDKKIHILGSEACMWTEFAPPELADALLYPRLLALADVLWSPGKERDFGEFRERLQAHYPVLSSLGVRYGAEDEPYYARIRYHLRLARIFLSILREDPEAAMENLKRRDREQPPGKQPR